MSDKKTTVALLAIVKNESKVIKNMLNSVVKYIDTYCIIDTGSTDNTVEIITDFMDKNGISGEIYKEEWTDFATARNKYLEYGKDIADYGIAVDADCLLVVENEDWKSNLPSVEENAIATMDIPMLGTSTPYSNSFIIRLRGDGYPSVEYRLPTHECLMRKDNSPFLTNMPFEGIALRERGTGSNRVNKFERDRDLLTEFIKDNDITDPLMPRAYYYLGQSLVDMGKEEDELKAYHALMSAMALSNWKAEICWSAYRICLLETIPTSFKHKALDMCYEFMTKEVAYCKLYYLIKEYMWEDALKIIVKFNELENNNMVDTSGFSNPIIDNVSYLEMQNRVFDHFKSNPPIIV